MAVVEELVSDSLAAGKCAYISIQLFRYQCIQFHIYMYILIELQPSRMADAGFAAKIYEKHVAG